MMMAGLCMWVWFIKVIDCRSVELNPMASLLRERTITPNRLSPVIPAQVGTPQRHLNNR